VSADSGVDDGTTRRPASAVPTRFGLEPSLSLGNSAPGANGPDPSWPGRYRRLVQATDTSLILAGATVAVLVGWSGAFDADRARLVTGLVSAVVMIAALPLARAWDVRVLGYGPGEFKRLMQAVVGSSVVMALGGYTLFVLSVRIWVFLVIPLIGLTVATGRFLLRKWLHAQRARGRCSLDVLAVGSDEAVRELIDRTRRDVWSGWRVTGVCTSTGRGPQGAWEVGGVPVVGDLDSVGTIARTGLHQVVAVCQAPGWGPGRLQKLAWELEGIDADLAVDPGLMEVAGPRMHITPVDGLPLLRLSKPRFTGAARVMKAALDRSAAALLLFLMAPVLIGIAFAVRRDGGPAFFLQERVGANGRSFRVVKFRSMCVDAEARLAELQSLNEGAGPLFKLTSDPRVTRVGATLRKYSLDELPQLLNVLNGTMSLVGPRPPLPSEVATYAEDARRRLLVRPGMTGLWQVSGRSNLSWEQSVRLDLRYVENWSLALDLMILWKTVGTVVRPHGAY
jgi:exopolysaccharide biosynthesis polyprenyl glycosylphosphotransferase